MNDINIDCSFLEQVEWKTKDQAMDRSRHSGCPVHVYVVNIEDHLQFLTAYQELLSPDESYRASAYHHERDTHRFIVSRGILRRLLALQGGSTPSAIRFAKSASRKPYQVGEGQEVPEFNVSHAGNKILIALSFQPVGADVEMIDKQFGFSEVLDYAFAPAEKEMVLGADDPHFSFFTLWSRKESLLKATGKGIGNNLQETNCLDGRNTARAELVGSVDNWKVFSFMVEQDYIGNISFVKEDELNFFRISPDWFF